jgi:gamma-glutamyltranspeptidase/glutathione hydrolase
MTLQEAVEAPRVFIQNGPLEVEDGFPPHVRAALEARGHEVKIVPRVAGGMNGVLMDPHSRQLRGAACRRADGAPMGMSGGYTDRVTSPGVPV